MPGKSYQKQMLSKEYSDHLQRITSIKSMIDSKPPRAKLQSKKKEIDRQRRCNEIEMDNRLLLERLVKTMQNKTIDNENTSRKFQRSLISTHRKLELQRITQENQRLLKRIQETEPCYNHLLWEEEAKKREIYLRNMSEFHDISVAGGGGGGGGGGVGGGASGAGKMILRNKSATIRRKPNEFTQQSQNQYSGNENIRGEYQQQQQHSHHQHQQSSSSSNLQQQYPPINGLNHSHQNNKSTKLRPISAPRSRMIYNEFDQMR